MVDLGEVERGGVPPELPHAVEHVGARSAAWPGREQQGRGMFSERVTASGPASARRRSRRPLSRDVLEMGVAASRALAVVLPKNDPPRQTPPPGKRCIEKK